MILKTHKELAKLIEGKKILHCNSLGKDSVVALEWLATYARTEEIHSVFFEFLAKHPDDERYFQYLKKRYPKVNFIKAPNSVELTLIASGVYQSPLETMHIYNHFEYVEFKRDLQISEIKAHYACDYICNGASKYEDFSRRVKFHQKGLEFKNVIYPLGMMTRAQVVGLIKSTGLKLHPCYKFSKGTYDHPSYWKMRASMLTNPEYRDNLLKMYPLLCLDEFRYERLL